jgi:hypothetical protein
MSLFFNGALITTPSVVSKVDDSALLPRGNSVGNTLALIGKSTGGKPNSALVFGSPDDARKTLVSGDLLDACVRAFNPSAETGAPLSVTCVRVNPATQATLNLRDSSSTVVIQLAATDYGLRTNQVKAKVEAAGGGRGLKLTTQLAGDVYTQDNIFRNAFQVQYTGGQASGVMTINGTTVTLQAPSGSTVATIDLNTYVTVQQLVDRINSVTSFTANVLDGNGLTTTLQALDFVTAQDVKTAAYTARADLQAAVDWFNSTSEGLVDATRPTEVGTLPAVQAFTYLSGGSDGSTTNSEWQNGFTTLQTVDVQWLTPCSNDPAIHAMADAHAAFMSLYARKERRCVVGAPLSTSDATALTLAKNINSDRTSLVHMGGFDLDANGTLVLYQPFVIAAMIAGAFCGVSPGTPLTGKSLKLRGLERKLRNPTDTDILLSGGVLPLEDVPTGFRIVQSISTWLTDKKFNRREQSVGAALDFTARSVRDALASIKGSKGTPAALALAVSNTETVLKGLAVPEPNGPGVLAGDAASPAYSNITAKLDGDVIAVSFQCSPVIPVNYVAVTIFAKPFSGSASAA